MGDYKSQDLLYHWVSYEWVNEVYHHSQVSPVLIDILFNYCGNLLIIVMVCQNWGGISLKGFIEKTPYVGWRYYSNDINVCPSLVSGNHILFAGFCI
jgi:hypothetical protein